MLEKDWTSSKVSDKKRTSLLLLTFFRSQRKISNEPRFSQFSSYLKRSLPISVYKMQNMKCKVYATPVLRSAKKKESKKENANELFATISKRNKLVDYMYMCSYGFWLKC